MYQSVQPAMPFLNYLRVALYPCIDYVKTMVALASTFNAVKKIFQHKYYLKKIASYVI